MTPSSRIHRVTVTQFCSISMPVDFCRRLVGKTLRNVCHCDRADVKHAVDANFVIQQQSVSYGVIK